MRVLAGDLAQRQHLFCLEVECHGPDITDVSFGDPFDAEPDLLFARDRVNSGAFDQAKTQAFPTVQ